MFETHKHTLFDVRLFFSLSILPLFRHPVSTFTTFSLYRYPTQSPLVCAVSISSLLFSFESKDLWLTIKLIGLFGGESSIKEEKDEKTTNMKTHTQLVPHRKSESRWNLFACSKGRREKWFIIWFGFVFLSMPANSELRMRKPTNGARLYPRTLHYLSRTL